MKKVLTISVSGIGNTLMFTPFLDILRQEKKEWQVDLLTWNKPQAECLIGSNLCNNIYWFNKGLINKLKLIWKLRKERYNYSVVAFPSNKWQFHILAFLIGAKKKVIHSYDFGKIRTLSFLSNEKIKAIEGIHDVENNCNLLNIFGIDPRKYQKKQSFYLEDENKQIVQKWLEENGIDREKNYLVGVHAGAGPIQKKKWGIENFAKELNKVYQENKNTKIILFGGKEELEEKRALRKLLNLPDVFIFENNLKNTAELISKCNFFLSNDSGLMHVAATFGLKQKAVFKCTSWVRTSPWNDKAEVVKLNKKNNFKYPFYSCKV